MMMRRRIFQRERSKGGGQQSATPKGCAGCYISAPAPENAFYI
jgi:hypothetical protein